MPLIKSIVLPVFTPQKIPRQIIEKHILKYGFIFILIRWAYYSVIFSFFRDYKNDWAPFVRPPFGLSIDTYAFLQSVFALPFGIVMMSAIACCLMIFFKLKIKNSLSFMNIANILGVSYFFPFVIIQLFDKIAISIPGWNPVIIIPLHTAVLVWEAIVSIILIGRLLPVNRVDKFIGILIQVSVWILLCAILWR